jgi:alpha-glucosidase
VTAREWWRGGAIYQVYVRSFADGNGDGVGDLAGIRARLPYLHDLGVDAIWFNPWYPSPMADAGYDVADYRDIDPVFGTLAEAEALIREAHELGIRIIVDIVPNHCSDQHPWFREAVDAGPGSAARELFWFRDGRGPDGAEPPNNWQSIFGGPAWTRLPDGQWYLHLFDPGQPDFNWDNPKVREEFEDILRFWFDRGADGVRIDSVAVVVKDPELADFDPDAPPVPHPFTDRDGVHEIYQGWRRVADGYPEPRVLIGEIWLPDTERFARYLAPGELHTAFNFDFLNRPWDGRELRASIDATLAAHAPVGAPATWVLSNHDVTRHVTRYGRADTSFDFATRARLHGTPTDLALGTRRARAAALLSLALPGSVYVYQGEELGLWEVEDIPDALRQDPIFRRTHKQDLGRDGCRVPLPWSGDAAPFGFSPPDATEAPWLPQPAAWRALTAEAQQGAPDSMLELYRSALRVRRAEPGLGDGPMRWLDSPPDVLAFSRGDGFTCVVNLSAAPVPVPPGTPLLASGPLDGDGGLPADTAVWLRTADSAG